MRSADCVSQDKNLVGSVDLFTKTASSQDSVDSILTHVCLYSFVPLVVLKLLWNTGHALARLQIFINYEALPLWQPSPAPAPLSHVTDIPSSAFLGHRTTSISAWVVVTFTTRYPVYTPRIFYIQRYMPFLTRLPLHSVWRPPLHLASGMATLIAPQVPQIRLSIPQWWRPDRSCHGGTSCPFSWPFNISPLIIRRSVVQTHLLFQHLHGYRFTLTSKYKSYLLTI